MNPAPLLVFDRAAELLHILSARGCTAWAAANNADSTSRGTWPTGIFQPQRIIAVGGEDGELSGAYGPWFLRYDVPGRVGMGIHAGRQEKRDLAGRKGPWHATLGCIRTSAEAMAEIRRQLEASGGEALPVLWVPR